MQPLPARLSNRTKKKARARRQKLELKDLPRDILLHIVSHLSKSACISFRRVSRSFYALSSNYPLFTELWFSPYCEDRTAFEYICKHPFLGSHVVTILYDITRLRPYSIEDLRKLWPRSSRRRHPRKACPENHAGVWQYYKIVEEHASASVDEAHLLTDGLKRLPNVRTIRLAYTLQVPRFQTDSERISPLMKATDLRWMSSRAKHWTATIGTEEIGNIVKAIHQSGAGIEELDLWQDNISVRLSNFDGKERFEDLSVILSRLTRFTIKILESPLRTPDERTTRGALSFRKLLAMATGLQELRLWVYTQSPLSYEESRQVLGLLIEDAMLAQMYLVDLNGRSLLSGDLTTGSDYYPALPGNVWILKRRAE